MILSARFLQVKEGSSFYSYDRHEQLVRYVMANNKDLYLIPRGLNHCG